MFAKNPRSHIRYTGSTFALIVALVLFGVGAVAGAQPAGQIVVAQGVDATTMDPHMHQETSATNVLNNMFDGLTEFDRDNNIQPSLAVSWQIIDDLTWEFVLRDGVRFHNGELLTPEDVVFSIMRVASPDSVSPAHSRFNVIEDVKIVDERTVHIVTEKPYPAVAGILSDLFIIPKAYAEANPDKLAVVPIGTGPFKFVSWERDREVVMEAYEDHWRGAPSVERVVFRPIPEASTRLAELLTGGVDIITNVMPHTAMTVEMSGTARIEPIRSTRYIYVGMNFHVDSPLLDQRVRQALNYAVDKELIIESALMGHGYPMSHPLHDAHFGYNPDLEPYPYDPALARELLAEAGYPNGFTIEMMTPNGRYLNDRLAAEAIASQLGEVGVKVDLKVMEWGTYVDLVVNQKKPAPLFLLGSGFSPGLDADGIYVPYLGSNEQLSLYLNPELDEVLGEARVTLDADRRVELYAKAGEISREDAPWIYLWRQEDLYGVSNRVDWDPVSFEMIRMRDATIR